MRTDGAHWKSKLPNYRIVHEWIKRHYGKAHKCEMSGCNSGSNTFQWALREGKDYEKNIKNFIQLCSSCHKKYDLTDETRERLRESGKVNSWFVRDNPMNYVQVRAKISATKTKNPKHIIENNKPVVCESSGTKFANVYEAAFTFGLKISLLRRMLNGSLPNKTPLKYAESCNRL